MIDRPLATFLEEGLGIHVGTRDRRLRPHGARAIAVKVHDDRLHLTVFVAEVAAARLLPDLEANGQLAVVFARPVDDRSCQVKGLFTGSRPGVAEDRAVVYAQWNAFLASLEQIGIPRTTTEGWTIWPAVAITMKATALFDQTPGPHAGASLE